MYLPSQSSRLIFYVYAYLRKSNGTPYYIGKGKGSRAFDKHRGVTLPKDKSKIVIIESNLSEIGAFALERRLIRWYGRKDLGTGILNNRTDGGDGAAGYKHTEDTRLHLSKVHSGYIPKESSILLQKQKRLNNGKPYPDDARVKCGNSVRGLLTWNNGVTHKFSLESPGPGWTRGRIPRSNEMRKKMSDSAKNRKKK